MFAIPLIYYAPADSSLVNGTGQLTQQIDILPSVLDYLGYDEKFFAFGNSIFSTDTPRFVINEHSGSYLWFMNDYLLSSNGMEPAALYDFRTDSLCRRNILTKKKDVAQGKMIPYFRAFMQLYRSSVINNRLTVQTLNR